MEEKKKNKLTAIAEGAGKSAVDAFGKAKSKMVQAVDQNNDGKLDFKDASEVAGSIGRAVKRTAGNVKSNAEAKAREMEMKALAPIFEDDLEDANFMMPKLIRICEIDKKRAESEVCQGAIGYYTDTKELRVVNMYQDNVDKFGISFYPDASYEFYYVDPKDRDRYIALDEYFGYLKVERINELQRLAKDLGAKHFRVTYKEEKSSFSEKQESIHAKVNKNGATYDSKSSEKNFSAVEIAAELDCLGHEPFTPKLNYLQKDLSIQNLISLRMDQHSPISHHRFMINMSSSSGIKESDAIKIDAALRSFKASGNNTVVSETRNEARRYLEYEIDF